MGRSISEVQRSQRRKKLNLIENLEPRCVSFFGLLLRAAQTIANQRQIADSEVKSDGAINYFVRAPFCTCLGASRRKQDQVQVGVSFSKLPSATGQVRN